MSKSKDASSSEEPNNGDVENIVLKILNVAQDNSGTMVEHTVGYLSVVMFCPTPTQKFFGYTTVKFWWRLNSEENFGPHSGNISCFIESSVSCGSGIYHQALFTNIHTYNYI
jgi:hypothetical protein